MISAPVFAPKLRFQTRTRSWFVRIPERAGGGTRFFGSDEKTALVRYAAWADEFAQVMPSKVEARAANTYGMSIRSFAEAAPAMPLAPSPSTQSVADQLFQMVDSEAGPAGRANVRIRIRSFLAMFGSKPIASITPADLIAFKASLTAAKQKPNWICDQLGEARRLLRFAFEIDATPKPPKLGLLKNVPRGTIKSKAISADNARALIAAVYKRRPNLGRMMLLQVLCGLRPSEVTKLIYHQGSWVADGVYAIEGKTSRKTGQPRIIAVSAPAMRLLKATKAQYVHGNGYRHQCWHVGRALRKAHGDSFIKDLTGKPDLSPHELRHTAATLMLQSGKVSDASWRTIMGRTRAKVDRIYAVHDDCQTARKEAAVLATILPLSLVGL